MKSEPVAETASLASSRSNPETRSPAIDLAPAHRIDLVEGSPAALALVFALILAGTLAWTPSFGIVPPQPTALDERVRPPVWILEETDLGSGPGAEAAARTVSRFHQQSGGVWKTPVDRRTGRAVLFQGSGLPFLPGAGNGLRAADLSPKELDGSGKPTLESVASRALEFFHANEELFVPGRGELILSTDRSAVLEDGRIATADFDWLVDGVQVLGARVFARINNGNLVQAGTRLVGRIGASATPALGKAEALSRAFAYAGLAGTDGETVVEPGRLLFLPVAADPVAYTGTIGAGVDYLLVWEVAFRQRSAAPTWTARVNAHTGDVVEFFDSNLYAGQVTGGVYPRTVVDPETVWPFPFTTVDAGGPALTDVNGRFEFVSGPFSTGINGKYFDTGCQSCTNPAQPAVGSPFGSGILRLGTGGTDQVGNGTSTKADRNAFYHLNIVRLVAKKWLSIPWTETTITANVNITASCNAFYSGSVNFYRSSATCNNTGEISDVMQHEWGHGLDLNTAGGDGATGEATADAVAVHVTHSPLVGPYFNRNGSPVRNLDKNTTAKGLLTAANVATKCPAGGGPLGREVHCEGEIYGQTTWDLAQALVAKYGANTGWRESERIFFLSMPQATIYLPNQSGSVYDAYIAVDDDDGNLANGTPNGAEIYATFNTHLIAGTPRTSSPHCARPDQPIVTATPGCDQIALSWPAVAGATFYRVQKHWQTGPSPFLNVATVTGTSYVDTQVTQGLTYHYVVQAVNASACESSIDVETIVAPTPRSSIEAVSFTTDDTPAGNRSGTIDPGESIDITVTLQNPGSTTLTGIGNVLTSQTAGVTVTGAGSSYASMAPGQTAASSPAYRIAIAPSFPCGSPIDLVLQTTDPSTGCPMEAIPIRLTTGVEGAVRANYDFETSGGWIYDSANSNAATGAWIRGAPAGTNYQPSADVNATGVNCWYTAANASGADDIDDVDGGQVVLRSPSINLTGLSTAHLSYWRWFGQRDLGDDPAGDFLIVEVSNNGGTSWVPVENLGDGVSAPAWLRRDFAVEQFLPLTSTMRFRFRASDGVVGGDPGDIIEAAVDHFRITDQICDTTPPCFTPATFAGLAAAATGPSCGETDLSWASAASNCQNATITYRVYRSTSSGFVPDDANRVASSLAGTTYRDRFLQPGSTYYYVVRAFDSRSGEESNSIERSAVASTAADVTAPSFSGISSAGGGASCGETTVSWATAGESCSLPVLYRVYRSTNPSFTPSPATLVAETSDVSYTDAALTPMTSLTYIVRARDALGNEDTNTARATVSATILPRTVAHYDFEGVDMGWALGAPDDAFSGNWERGTPIGTAAQPDEDTTPDPGYECWGTGLDSGGSLGGNDVDEGTTTLLSPVIDMAGLVNPFVRYQRWYSNNQGSNPNLDTLTIQVSNDGGGSWVEFDSTPTSSNAWVLRQKNVQPAIALTSTMQFRFQAADLPGSASIVEAAIDDFEVIEPLGGCSGCAPQSPVGTILLDKSAGDVILSWTSDPVEATRYVVYRVTGALFDQSTRIGTTTVKTFDHVQAASTPEPFFYFVSAVNACGQESAIDTEP